MAGKYDVEKIKAATDIVALIERYVPLKKKGREWQACCPFHEERSPSFKVSATKQIYKCFGCGASGDAVTFMEQYFKIEFSEAIKLLANDARHDGVPPMKAPAQRPPEHVWKQISPVPANAPTPVFKHNRFGEPSKVWTYVTPNGEQHGYVCRYDNETGKDVVPLIYATDGERCIWKFQAFDTPRFLYNATEIVASDKYVLLVEGEKTADAAIRLLPRMCVTTWAGGGNADHLTDAEMLRGRTVVLFPDNDSPGIRTMHRWAERLKAMGCQVRWVKSPADAPKGWDLADASWTPDEATAYLRQNITEVPPVDGDTKVVFEIEDGASTDEPVLDAPKLPPPPMEAVVRNMPPPPPPLPPAPPPFQAPISEACPFRALGWDKNADGKAGYHFYSSLKKTILSFSASSLGTTQLLELADLTFWSISFPGKTAGFNLQAAQDWLIRESDKAGPFAPSVRGRGAWRDRTHTVIHNGSHLIVDGVHTGLDKFPSKHIYESAPDLGFELTEPLPDDKANQLMNMASLLNWEKEIHGPLLLGWCVVAPICGALTWRPHIWLTAPAGAGKSWVFQNIVRRLVGEGVLAAQGDSTEAGLRQTLGHDAIPVVFDEAEQEDEKASGRIQNVLALMRTASADDGGMLYKGSAGGTAKTFKIRSCFAYASIVPQLKAQADRTRVTVLTLTKRTDAESKERFNLLVRTHAELVTDEFVQQLRSRTVIHLPTIVKNIATFKAVATTVLGDARNGDQIGTLLAGAWSLVNTELVTYEQAEGWMRMNDWVEEKGLDQTRDEQALLNHILEHIERVESNSGIISRSVGELIRTAMSYDGYGETMAYSTAEDALGRIGIKVDRTSNVFMVANNHREIHKILAKTAWTNNHAKLLQRLTGAEATEPMRFKAGTKSRAIAIPISYVSE
jgi:putative DNA primase/helicase